MRDVAASAGVSLKTVSRVVNDEPSVREETAKRVRDAIERLAFAPNELASSLRRGRAGAIGLVIEDLGNPFYSGLASAVEQVADEHGHLLLIGSCGEDAARERELVVRFLRRAVDALLLVPAGGDHSYLLSESGAGVPLVSLDRFANGIELDTIVSDNRGGARTAVDHLLAHGHRRIAVVADHPSVWTWQERIAGYREALAAAGLGEGDRIERTAATADEAQAAVAELLALPQAERPTALFTGNNRITVGALHARHAAGAQTALVGFDDVELADLLRTPVTVVRQSAAVMGRVAAEIAYARLDGEDGPPSHRVLPCELVIRGSGEIAP
jgi:LacI family transcriptional regulator